VWAGRKKEGSSSKYIGVRSGEHFDKSGYKTEIDAAISYNKFIMENKMSRNINFPIFFHILNWNFLFILWDKFAKN
jgi:hypothetical protein